MGKEKKTKVSKTEIGVITDIESLCRNSIDLINYARSLAVKQINVIELMTNYAIGRWIVEEQQNGEDRAQYGAHVIVHIFVTTFRSVWIQCRSGLILMIIPRRSGQR